MRDLNFNHLHYFWAVAHAGSLTRAAERLHLSQSALSAQIQKLEHQIGHPPVRAGGPAPRPDRRPFRFPDDVRSEPLLLPSLDSDIRVAFDRVLELAGIRPIVLAEVDDMAMLRLLARERDGPTLVPPIVVRDELQTGR